MSRSLVSRLILFYQRRLSCCLPAACRFEPTCSEYWRQAVLGYGILRGSLRGLRRILSCHPYSSRAAYDPLP